MDICKTLNSIKKAFNEKTLYDFFYDFSIDSDDEINFAYRVTLGWEEVKEATFLYNACDRQTNVNGLCKEMLNLWKFYAKVKEA